MNWQERLKSRLKPVEEINPPHGYKTVASVIIPIGLQDETSRCEILLTKRTEWVRTHKGQISFPGGNFKEGDASLLATALRETEEEIGLAAEAFQVLGRLDPVRTLKDVLIYPWVAWTHFKGGFKLSDAEVSQVLFLPVESLLKEGLRPMQVTVAEGAQPFTVSSIGIQVEGELVWGASARMLEQLKTFLEE